MPNSISQEAALAGQMVEKGTLFGSMSEKGAPGKTPVKGTDYWTSEDKAEIIQEVRDAELFSIEDVAGTCNITWTDGGYISAEDGTIKSENGFSYSDYVKIEPNEKIVMSNTMTEETSYNCWYGSDMKYISSFSNATGMVIAPNNAKYFRLSKYSTATLTVIKSDINSRIDLLRSHYETYVGKSIVIPNTKNDLPIYCWLLEDTSPGMIQITCCGHNIFRMTKEDDVDVDLSTGEHRPGYVTVNGNVLTTQLYASGYHPNGQVIHVEAGQTISISAKVISKDKAGWIGIYENGQEKIYKTGTGTLQILGYVCQTDNPIVGFTTVGDSGGAQFTDINVCIGNNVYGPETGTTYIQKNTGKKLYKFYGWSSGTTIFNDGLIPMIAAYDADIYWLINTWGYRITRVDKLTDAYINNLIDIKLGVIENGSY